MRGGAPSRAEHVIAQVALLAGAVLLLLPALLTGTFHRSHEEARYLLLADHFIAAFRDGVWYPRFLPDLYGGYGYPTFCFYQPGFFFFSLLFSYLPAALHQTMQWSLLALVYVGALGAYFLGREIAGVRLGLFAGLWFLLTPYLCVNLYVRGDLSELASMLLCPWPVFFLLLLDRRLQGRASPAAPMLGLALSIAAVILCHPAPPVALLPSLAVIALALGWRRPHQWALFLRVGASLLAALALSSPYWLTVFQLRPYVQFENLIAGYNQIELHTVWPHQLVSNVWGFGGSIPASQDDTMSFQLGAPELLVATLGAWFGRRSRVIVAAYGCYLALVLLMLPIAEPFWSRAATLRFLQFPWRLLAVTATLQVTAAMGLCDPVARHLSRRAQWSTIAALLFVSYLWHADQFQISAPMMDPEEVRNVYHRELKTTGFHHFANADEFTPRTVVEAPAAPRDFSRPRILLERDARARRAEGHGDHHLRFEVAARAPTAVVIQQLYLPGWRIWLNGEPLARGTIEAGLTAAGLMRVELPQPGRYRLEARYEGPPGWRLRNAGIAIVILVVLPTLRRPRQLERCD
jgi:hypothetical protein